jgi:hypothetical protein
MLRTDGSVTIYIPSQLRWRGDKKGALDLRPQVIKVYQLLAQDRWFSPASFITKTGRHDIAEILLKVALNTKIKIKIPN